MTHNFEFSTLFELREFLNSLHDEELEIPVNIITYSEDIASGRVSLSFDKKGFEFIGSADDV